KQVADGFATGLVHHGVTAEQWLNSIERYSTPGLMAKLRRSEPANVPAQRTTGQVRLVYQAATRVDADIPVDSGTLHLHLLATDGRWLVDLVEWQGTPRTGPSG